MKLINYGKQHIDSSDRKNVLKVLKKSKITQGEEVLKFEINLKKYFKSKYCVAVSNGSAALHLVAKALKWKKDDKVICSPITFISAINAILHVGAKPLFVDINLNDYSLDLDLVEQKLKKDEKIKAMIVTDYAGQPSDWLRINKFKKKYNIQLVNDNCHAIGSKINNDQGYAVKFSDAVCLSFHPVKTITTGEGGAILTNNIQIYQSSSVNRSHGIIRSPVNNKRFNGYYEVQELAYNYRITDFQCALGSSQLKKINKFTSKRNLIANKYDSFFSKYKIFKIPPRKNNYFNSYHLYPLLIDFKKTKLNRRKLFKHFMKSNIILQVHYVPVNTQPLYKKKIKFKKKEFRSTINFYNQEVSLPIYYELTNKEIQFILNQFKKVFKLK